MPRFRGSVVAKGLLLLAVLAFCLHFARRLDWGAIAQQMLAASKPLVTLAVILLMSRGALLAGRWMLCLPLLGTRFSRAFVLTAQLAAILLNHATPTARLLGGVYRARCFSRRYAVPFADAYGTVFLDQTTQQAAQALITWAMLAIVAWQTGSEFLAGALAAGLTVLLGATLLWRRGRLASRAGTLARGMRALAERRARRLGDLLGRGRRWLEILRCGFADRQLQIQLAAMAVAVLAVSGTAQWLIFLSLDLWVSPWWAVAVVSVGIAAGVLTGTPGGLATTEAAMIAAYVALGIDEVAATAATLLFRGLHYAVVLALGLPALLLLELGGVGRLRSGDPPGAGASPTEPRPGT